MGGSCTYFTSDRWAGRLEDAVARRFGDGPVPERNEDTLDPGRELAPFQYSADPSTPARVGFSNESTPSEETIREATSLWETAGFEFPDTCPHEEVGDTGLCLFHLPVDDRRDRGITADDVRVAFLERLRGDEAAKQFVGATFTNLDLSNERLISEDRHPIDLRLATVSETLLLENSTVSQGILLSGARLGTVSFDNGELEYPVVAHDTIFTRSASFHSTTFRDRLELWAAEFESDVTFYTAKFDDYAEFRGMNCFGEADFRYTHFGRDGEFWGVRFDRSTSFHAASFDGYAEFRGTSFGDTANFRYVQFGRDAEFWDATFSSEAVFYAVNFSGYAEFEDATFHDLANFRYAKFERDAEFWSTIFQARVDFRRSRFTEAGEFENTTFEQGADFREAEFARAIFRGTKSPGPHVDLSHAILETGAIVAPPSDPAFYDFSGATIGDVDLESENDGYQLFEFFRFYDTEFREFDFPGHRGALQPTWRIHQFGGNPNLPTTSSALESTYLKAKNGAIDSGDKGSGAEFFLQEMKYRRRGYLESIQEGDYSLQMKGFIAGKWATSWIYNLTCGYGERPHRTIGFSFGLIVIFAFIYRGLGLQVADGAFIGHLTFSFQTFVALILGVPEIDSVVIQLLAAFQAFLGAFFIALFVFTLARSIRRR